MDKLRPFLRSAALAAHALRRSLRRLLASRLGIAARLSFAFVAVAVLAVAANQIAERGDTLLNAIASTPVVAPGLDERTAELLPAALDRYQRAVLARTESPAEMRSAALTEASTSLEDAREGFAAAVRPDVREAVLAGLDDEVEAHAELGAQAVRSADARRRLLNELDIEFQSLDARVKSSLDRVWAVFGKVIGRDYLVEASRTLDELARYLDDLDDLHGYGPATIRAVAVREKAFAGLLAENEQAIARVLGPEWLAETRASVDRVVWLRELLVRTDAQRKETYEAFAASHVALATTIRRVQSQFESARALESARRQSAEVLSAVNEQERRRRSLFAWLSAAVLLLLLATIASTVRSVVLPVRRLLRATERLSHGETGVVVPRGGVRELDTLAVSFNQMAERLSAAQELARQYHGQLEAKVEERTRQLQHLAAHDPLTRLPNRRQFLVQLHEVLARATERDALAGVFFLDLDNFKNVNDSMGHVFGDRVLQAVSERLRDVVRDIGFCARLGGDEFTVVVERVQDATDLEQAAERLVEGFQDPLVVDGRELLMGLSVGASLFPVHGRDPEGLLRAADAALFHAKAQGRSRLRVFSPELLEAAAAKFATEQGLRRAVERGEFELHFQPEVDLATCEVGVVEALLRWRLPDGSHASPHAFLPIAEECGLIREIGEWVIQSTVEHAARWRAAAWPPVRIAVNVSALQLLDSRFVHNLANALDRHRLAPQCIEIELTENVLQTARHTTEALAMLRELGVGVALDDFGTGYSSLVSLQQLPLTRVKLDRSLIATIDSSSRSQAITRAIISLCQSLGLEVTAEGIERHEQLAWLLGYPAMHVQGYLLSAPVAEADLLTAINAMPARMDTLLLEALPSNAVPIARLSGSRLRKQR
ncbi:MAG TPA: EAL domain-containing protein [Steroidobacteraceae bacterium]|nr:EAL domain-containing protein [Steroidobacteraceae bacterium]